MELPMTVIVAVVAAVIILLIIIGVSIYVKNTGSSAIQSLWDIGKWIQDLLHAPA